MRFILTLALLVAGPLFGQYSDVPDAWKSGPPFFGPYVQAPENCGAKWYPVSPFSQQPWLRECSDFVDPKKRDLPAGFVDVFGPEPVRLAGESTFAYLPRLNKWLQDLQYFRSAGPASEFDAAAIADARRTYADWKISDPKFYTGRYGHMVRFVDEDRQFGAHETVFAPHYVIAYIQSKQLQEGKKLDRVHPYVPPFLYKEDEE